MAGLGAYALISTVLNLVTNLLPKVMNTLLAPSSSSSTQASDAQAVEAELRRLERMLARIKATLYDAEERIIQDISVQLWLTEIKDLGHQVENILEEYMYEMYQVQVEARNASQINPIKGDLELSDTYSVQNPRGMVDRIRYILSRFEEIAKDRDALYLREEDAARKEKNKVYYSRTSPVVEEISVFGREEEKEKVINLLFSGGDEVISVLPIVGKGGIGKTTVAQLVYNDKRVQDSFDLVGWINPSDNFSVEHITQHILESFTRSGCTLKNPSVLIEEFANRVKGKRVFLVLDDVWNKEKRLWELLRMPLMRARKAILLVTTRDISVARIMQTMEPLKLAYLSDDKCWLLFTHYAFQGIGHANDQDDFVKIGKRIVKKCGGLPLAVRLIASLLSHKKEEQSWMDVLQSDLWESDAGKDVLAALQISYDHLPAYLKPCLLLCAMFPKNHEYSMNLMSRLWIANNYIEPKGKKPIEEVAADYAKMLHERSFFDDYNFKCDNYGLPIDITFRIHDMVYDLALLNSSDKSCSSVEPFISKEVCHLHLSKELWELPGLLSATNISRVRTLSMRNLWSMGTGKQIDLNILSKAEQLRALDLNYEAEDVLPFSLGNMKHLHYLSVGGGIVERILPQSIFSCYSLRILILNLGGYHMELDGIGSLINLEILQLYEWDTSVPFPESVGLLEKLRVLEIHGDGDYGKFELPECIGNLAELHRIVISDATLEKLPDSICRLGNLNELILVRTSLSGLPEYIGNLPNLQFLFLQELHCNIPLSCRKLIRSSMVMQQGGCEASVGWLEELHDEEALTIKDIFSHPRHMSIEDAGSSNLIRIRNFETLISTLQLLWHYHLEQEVPRDFLAKKGTLGISIDYSKTCGCWDFETHPKSLRHLYIHSSCWLELPRWMGDYPLSCASLVKLCVRSSSNISSLPLGMVLSLKHFYKADCGRLLHLNWESLPSQLKHSTIHQCNSLAEVEVQLESLTELQVHSCYRLKSLSTVTLKSLLTFHLYMLETTSKDQCF